VHRVPAAKYRRSARVVSRPLADGTSVLLHLDTAAYHELNPIGALVWDAMGNDEATELSAIVEHVRRAVDDAPPAVSDDVAEFLDALTSRGLAEADPT
jgi:hypothetical protein